MADPKADLDEKQGREGSGIEGVTGDSGALGRVGEDVAVSLERTGLEGA